ncbi:DUF1491 family protein [Roseobacter weihaiensis]|uniref:DUF1491 family protein n=1 Tax=Roseobacter weihaiensis TaxID=2763262 RepID=UPI001D09D9E9|nr:DUF1491 family protein [Roseobacter sp. H9]
MVRLTARFWVDAYLARLRALDIPAYVVSHGDDTAGSVLVKLNTLNGQAQVFQRSYNMLEDTRHWAVLEDGEEADIDAAITRQRGFDPDIWVIEVEDRQGRHLLDTSGLT